MTPEMITILAVWGAGFVGLAGLMLSLFNRLERRMDRLEDLMDRFDRRMDRFEDRMDRLEARIGALEQGQAELKGAMDVIREVLLARTVQAA